MERALRIAIDGPIGVGKTTLARLLAERLGFEPVYEEVEKNPFLPDFYRDPQRFALQTQFFFLILRYTQQVDLVQPGLFAPRILCDYLFEKDRIFATLTLEPAELALYDKIYELLSARVPAPDLVVYLTASVPVLMERIGRRGRSYEAAMEPDYLDRLSASYSDFFARYRRAPVVRLDTGGLDFVRRPEDLETIIRTLRGVGFELER